MDPLGLGFIAFLVVWVGVVAVAVALALRFRRWATARHRAAGTLECGLRVVSGQMPGLSRRWRHGLAEIEDGVLIFRQGRLGGYVRGRDPKAPDVRVEGPLSWDRTPQPRERLALASRTQVFKGSQPDGAVVEIVTLDACVPRLQEAMAS